MLIKDTLAAHKDTKAINDTLAPQSGKSRLSMTVATSSYDRAPPLFWYIRRRKKVSYAAFFLSTARGSTSVRQILHNADRVLLLADLGH